MPTLQFKGKNIIWNHHLSVPYHTLEEIPKLHFQPEKANGNLIIEGDNLLALKSLLPMYAGKVKVVCIDPPYNTGNEGWIYNDKVNSPLIKDWLDREVGKDDMTRHDKWLCMMTPRLKLLRELLADDGAIFVNIDDNEVHHLRSLMDEVFGEENFITQLIWRKRAGGGSDSKYISIEHEYCILYGKSIDKAEIKKLELDDKTLRNYPYKDDYVNTRGKYCLKPLHNDGLQDSPGLHYDIECPDGSLLKGTEHQWVYSESTFKDKLKDGRIEFKKSGNSWKIYYKVYLNEEKGTLVYDEEGDIAQRKRKPLSILYDVSLNKEGNSDLSSIAMNNKFDYPKPVNLIKHLLKLGSDKSSLILDSFSGSGTTGHATLDLNKEDGGNRKFILVQMTEATENEPNKNICKDITRERTKRAIEKYGYDSGLRYLRVGQPLDAETLLEGRLPEYKVFAKYVYYLCTGENLKEENKISEKNFFVENFGRQAIYLIYKQDYEKLTKMALNLEIAEKIIAEQPDKKRIVYAPACFLDEEYMEANQIEFVSIPYNLFQRKQNGG